MERIGKSVLAEDEPRTPRRLNQAYLRELQKEAIIEYLMEEGETGPTKLMFDLGLDYTTGRVLLKDLLIEQRIQVTKVGHRQFYKIKEEETVSTEPPAPVIKEEKPVETKPVVEPKEDVEAGGTEQKVLVGGKFVPISEYLKIAPEKTKIAEGK